MMNEMLIGILFLSKIELHISISPDNPCINGSKTENTQNVVDHEVTKVETIGESLG